MSKKVDERVVEMRFDNQQFESGVKTTMSTLDKLKAALKFSSSSKSLEGVANAAKKVDFSGMSKGIETVNAKFSAMQVVGMTALSNITSAAMRAGTNLVKSFTLDPVISGFQEYETQLNSVQTIMANTSSKGTTLDQVNEALAELNTYADQTIYNFTEMTRNIGTFTAAGVDLETSVSAIKGIANLAAVSGSTSQQASTAMYQLSQALAAGRVSLMDWNSVVNAGMGGEVFQNALKRTATVMGKDVDAIIEKYGSFRESLTSGEWLTTDVLTETLKQFTMAAEEGSAQWDEFKKSLMDQGYTEAQATEILKMANTATDAATKVKTFTQLMDTLKEAMGSGWATTWQLIFGDFEEAKAFWTEMSDMFSGIINNFSDARNNVIEAAMGGGESRWGEFTETLDKAGVSVESFQKKLGEVYKSGTGGSLDDLIEEYGSLEKAIGSGKISADMISKTFSELAVSTDGATESTKSLAEWQKVVDDVWRGDYGNIDTGRMEKLAAAGWEYAEVQKLVNMTVDGHRLTLEDLNAAQLVSMGYTKEQAAAIEELAKQASAAGTPLNELINDLIEPKRSGRELFLEGIKNVLEAIMKPLGAIADAFGAVFAIDADGLYDLIKGFNEFSKAIIISGTDAANLGKTFKGLFSIVKLIGTGVGKTLTFAFKAANALLAPFGTNVLEITGAVGEAIYQFSEWVSSGKSLGELFDSLGDALGKFMIPITNFTNWLADLPVIGDALRSISDAFGSISNLNAGDILGQIPKAVSIVVDGLKEAYNTLKGLTWQDVLNGLSNFGTKVREFFSKVAEDMKEIGPDIIEGLQNGLLDGVEGVVKFLQDLGTKIIEAICAVLGIHSPSTVFFEIGTNIVQGLCDGIRYLSDEVSGVIYDLVEDIKYALSGIDWGVVLPVAGAIGSFAILYQMTDALQGFAQAAKDFASPMKSISNLGGSLKTTVDGFNNLMGFTQNNTSIKFKQMAEGVKILAEAIAILAGSVAALTLVDTGKMWIAIGAIGALAVIIGALAAALNHFANGATVIQSLQLNTTLLSIAGSFLLLSVAAKVLGTMDSDSVNSASIMLAEFTGVVTALVLLAKFAGGKNLNLASSFLTKVGACFILLGVAARLLGGMDATSMKSAGIMLAAFTGVVSALMLVTKFAGKDLRTASKFIAEIGGCFVLLGIAARLVGGMDTMAMNKAISFITAFGFVVAGLIAATKLAGDKSVDAIGSTIFKIAGAIAILGATAIILGSVDTGQLIKGGVAVAALGAIVVGLMKLVQMMGPGEAAKVGATLLAMSLAIGVLGGIAVLLGLVDPSNLAKGVIAVGFLAAMMIAMTKATAGASDVKGTMMGIAVAIGVMAASVAVLSFIDPIRLGVATAAMTVLMGVFAFVAKSASNVQTSLPVMITMVAAIGVMAAAVAILAQMPWENTLASAVGLSAMLIAMAQACKILSGISSVAPMALAAAVVLTAVVAVLAAVLYAIRDINPAASLGNAIALSVLLLAMSASISILGSIGALGPAIWNGLAALGALAVGIGVIVGIVSAIAYFSDGAAIEAVNKGAELFRAIGNAIGSFVSGIGEGLTSGLPNIASNLSGFITNLNPFLEGVKGIDPSIGTTIQNLGTGLLALTGAGVIDAIASVFGAGSMIGSIGEQLVPFGQAMADFAGTLSGVDLAALLIGSQAAKAIADMANAMPKEGGILDSIFGSTVDLGTFGEQLTSFGDGMKKYAESIAGVDVASIQNSIPAAEGLAELANKLPAEGGLMQSIFGTQVDLSTFGDQLIDFGDGLQQYASKVAGLDTESINNSIPAAEALNNLAGKLPSGGGLMESIFGGKDDLSDFGTQLTTFGDALVGYGETVGGLDTGAIEGSIDATNGVLNVLRSYANAGDIDTGVTNAKKIKDVGDALKGYSEKISGVDPTKLINTNTAIEGLKNTINNLVGLDSSGVANFQAAIDQLASTNVQALIDTFSNIDMSSIGMNLMSSLAAGITAGGTFATLAATLVSTSIVLTLTLAAVQFEPIGLKSVTQYAAGITRGSALAVAASLAMALSSSAAATSAFGFFYSAGYNAAIGFANGIASGSFMATIRARAMANAAAAAARSALNEHSPSKVLYEIGAYAGEGFTNALNDYAPISAKAGENMANSATDGISKSISSISDALNTDLDVNPTIRPVLDLSDVRSGADSINGMFDSLVPMDVLGRVNSISRSMDSRIQNGSFNDVVGAIDKLRTNLSELVGTTYNVNGVTYDDGTNVANAVNDLTRAIRLERRV